MAHCCPAVCAASCPFEEQVLDFAPTESLPCLGNTVSSTTHAESGSSSAVIRFPSRAQTSPHSQGLCPTNCCMACTFPSGSRRPSARSIFAPRPAAGRARTVRPNAAARCAPPAPASRAGIAPTADETWPSDFQSCPSASMSEEDVNT